MAWDDRFQSQYGFFRPYVRDVIYRYLNCGDLRLGFARVRCGTGFDIPRVSEELGPADPKDLSCGSPALSQM
jgi:hypothetical protein